MNTPRVLAIGLDGYSVELADRLMTEGALPALAAQHAWWPLRDDHCFMRVALDHAFRGCWYDSLDRARGSALGQMATPDLARAVAVAARMECEGGAAVRALNEQSVRWRRERSEAEERSAKRRKEGGA